MKRSHYLAVAILLALPLSIPAAEPVPKGGFKAPSTTKAKQKARTKATPTEGKRLKQVTEDKPAEKIQSPEPTTEKPTAPANASVTSAEILEFDKQPAGVRALIESCLALTTRNLTYTFGSADPAAGGMDCSGFVYYVLRQHGLTQVPRDSSSLYSWVRKSNSFRSVLSRKADSFEMAEMLPGDLLFWVGTYDTPNDPPISHVMIYLGTEKSTGQAIMVGSSNGRTYHGQKQNGVSVFDFQMPKSPKQGETTRSFVGYSRIPGLRD